MTEKKIVLKNGNEVIMRTLGKEDMKALISFFYAEDKGEFPRVPVAPETVESWFNQVEEGELLIFGAQLVSENHPMIIGSLTLSLFDNPMFKHKAEIGAGYVHEDYRGVGILSSIVKFALDIARERGIKKIYGPMVVEKKPLVDMIIRMGGVIEGTLKMDRYYGDKYHDAYYMAIYL